MDSFCCLNRNFSSDFPNHKITHLCLFDFPMANTEGLVDINLFFERRKILLEIAKEKGLSLLDVCTNINDFYDSITARWVHTAYTVGIMLCLQKYYGIYYFASNYPLAKVFDMKNAFDDKWGNLLLDTFSNQNIRFYLESMDLGRVQKMEYVVDDCVSKKYLSVCGYDYYNCGICEKCIRTLVTLDLMGALEDFSAVFDLDSYRKKRKKYLSRVYGRRRQTEYYREIEQYRKKSMIRYPFTAYIIAPWFQFTGFIRIIITKNERKHEIFYKKLRALYRSKLKRIM